MKLAIFANGIISTKIGGAQKHMREVIQFLPDFYDVYFFPEPQMFGNSHIIDFQFIEFLKKKEVKISKYFLDNYSSKPVIEDIIKNYSNEMRECNIIYDMDFQYFLDNIKFGGELSLRLSNLNNIKLAVCIQDIGDINSHFTRTFLNILKFSRMANRMTLFITAAGFYNMINRKITVTRLLKSKHLSLITMVNTEYEKNIKINFKNIYLLNPSNALDSKIINYRENEKGNQIIFYARLIYQKGLFDVLYIHKKINESYNIKLKISGKFQRDFEKREFYRIIKKLNIEDKVEYLGVLEDNDLYRELARSKLMLYPSHSDSFSISVLQALFLHVPVVAYDIPGLSLYKDFKAVALVREFDINSMARMAEKFLVTGNELFDEQNLEDFIAGHAYWKSVADSHISAINSVIKRV
ncbi:glycosyltransferase [Ferroplasma sp.]|uniref:glycosyltransferase n=1 Tax=Ferroplasma sp. TaxID=2591003 RepID=UPI00260603A9|nr:glycosyltransferase [Ferroplasma sp.]